MEWKTESDNEEFNEKPYSALSTEDPDRFLSRPKYPRILLGLVVVLLIVLAIVFFSGNTEKSSKSLANIKTSQDITARLDGLEAKLNEVAGIQQQVDQLGDRIVGIEENLKFINDGHITPKTEWAKQMQANAQTAEAASRRLDAIEKRLNELEAEMKEYASKSNQQTANQSSKQITVHVVKKGDTLYSIARKYNLKLSQLLRANSMDNKAVIYPGQELKIPK